MKLVKDSYSEKDDFTVNGVTISILGKTCTGEINIEYNKDGTWIFKTVSPNFDLNNL